MIPSINKKFQSCSNQKKKKKNYVYKEKLEDNDDKKYHKIRDYCHYRGTAHSIRNLRYKILPKNIKAYW